MAKKRNLLPTSVGISLGCFAVLVVITPLLIIFRWFGMVSANTVPNWLIILMVIGVILHGIAMNRKFFWDQE